MEMSAGVHILFRERLLVSIERSWCLWELTHPSVRVFWIYNSGWMRAAFVSVHSPRSVESFYTDVSGSDVVIRNGLTAERKPQKRIAALMPART
jgi:hypothetical protein